MYNFKKIQPGNDVYSKVDNLNQSTVFITKQWLKFISETQNAEPIIIQINYKNIFVGYFIGLIIKKFGFNILGSPLPGWTTSYMGFSFHKSHHRAIDVLKPFSEYVFKHLKCIHFEIMDRNISEQDCIDSQFKYDLFSGYEVDLEGDDGSKSFYEIAFPILKKYNLSAIVFIDTNGIGKQRMSIENIKEISEYGIQVQSHSHSHLNHFRLSESQIAYEGEKSKDIIYNITGKEVNKYAFPHSPYSLKMCSILNELGYKSFFTSDYGTQTKKYDYSVSQRINIYKDRNIKYFLWFDKIVINRLKIELSKFRLRFSNKY